MPTTLPATTDTARSPRDAPVWNAIWAQRGMVQRLIALVREGLHALHRRVLLSYLTRDAELLELGCGPASLTLSLAPRIRHLVGIDISDEALRRARANQQRLGVTNAEFVRGDCRAVPFAEAFDVVWSAGLIEHFFDRDINVVRQHVQALRPGGIAFMSVPAKWSPHHLHYLLSRPRVLRWLWPWSNVRDFQRFYTPRALRRLGAATGHPFRVFYLPPTLIGALLGILVLEIHPPSLSARMS